MEKNNQLTNTEKDIVSQLLSNNLIVLNDYLLQKEIDQNVITAIMKLNTNIVSVSKKLKDKISENISHDTIKKLYEDVIKANKQASLNYDFTLSSLFTSKNIHPSLRLITKNLEYLNKRLAEGTPIEKPSQIYESDALINKIKESIFRLYETENKFGNWQEFKFKKDIIINSLNSLKENGFNTLKLENYILQVNEKFNEIYIKEKIVTQDGFTKIQQLSDSIKKFDITPKNAADKYFHILSAINYLKQNKVDLKIAAKLEIKLEEVNLEVINKYRKDYDSITHKVLNQEALRKKIRQSIKSLPIKIKQEAKLKSSISESLSEIKASRQMQKRQVFLKKYQDYIQKTEEINILVIEKTFKMVDFEKQIEDLNSKRSNLQKELLKAKGSINEDDFLIIQESLGDSLDKALDCIKTHKEKPLHYAKEVALAVKKSMILYKEPEKIKKQIKQLRSLEELLCHKRKKETIGFSNVIKRFYKSKNEKLISKLTNKLNKEFIQYEEKQKLTI